MTWTNYYPKCLNSCTVYEDETIVAISSPPGRGAISIIRLSGKKSFDIINRVFSKRISPENSHQAIVGKILDNREIIDDVVLIPFKKGSSYTGYETIEVMCHGNPLICSKISKLFIREGASPARAGQFTYWAYMNGRIDLIQSEAVQALISSKNELALNAARKQLDGLLSDKISDIKEILLDISSDLEASIEYPDEEIEIVDLNKRLQAAKEILEKYLNSFQSGNKIVNGIEVFILGLPNVGKSSLMNSLLEKDRSIVTDIPGTTRDIIREEINISGITFVLNDAAGIRKSSSKIEKEGIKKAKDGAKNADMVLLVTDISKDLSHEEEMLIKEFPDAILVANKCDLDHTRGGLKVSTKRSLGIERLKKAMVEKANVVDCEETFITNDRHYFRLNNTLQHVNESISSHSFEIMATRVADALKELCLMKGEEEDILTKVFSKFCLGK